MKLCNYVRSLTHVLTVICFFIIFSAMCAEIEVGNELPVFGKRYTDNPLDIDAMYERMAVWYHPCVERTPIREVSKKDMRRWLQKRINYRRMGVDNKSHAGREYLSRIEMLLAETCAEMYRYGLRYNASEPIEMINRFYNTNNYHHYWERETPTWEFEEIIRYCDACMDRLDRVHETEYKTWAKNNPEEWDARNKAKEARMQREAVAKKWQDLEERTRLAENRANEAEQRAAKAEAVAALAQLQAADAEAAAGWAQQNAANARAAAAAANARANAAASRAEHEAMWSNWR